MSSTHSEHCSDGYRVVVQHCDYQDCDEYLGVNYPRFYCKIHQPIVEALIKQTKAELAQCSANNN